MNLTAKNNRKKIIGLRTPPFFRLGLPLLVGGLIVWGTAYAVEKSYWIDPMVRQYVHHSELNRRWAWALLAKYKFNGDEKILDVGTGDGKIAADLSLLVPQGKVVGIDPSEGMISWAKRQFHPLEYPNLSFRIGSFLDPQIEGEKGFDYIVSFCALQFAKDPTGAFREMAKLLSPTGKFLLTFPADGDNVAWTKARKTVARRPKWHHYWKNGPAREWNSLENYREFANKAGFKSVKFVRIETMDPFVDKRDYIEWWKGVISPVIPANKQDEYISEMINEYIALSPESLSPEGVYYARFGRYEAELVLK